MEDRSLRKALPTYNSRREEFVTFVNRIKEFHLFWIRFNHNGSNLLNKLPEKYDNLNLLLFLFHNSLLIAREVQELLYGNEEKYKGITTSSLNDSTSFSKPKVAKATIAPVPNSTHLDAVPQATPINRYAHDWYKMKETTWT